ncbi:hypothetical protein BST23_01150 [Mycolicibacterium elephantis]|uniref:Lipoprotein LpqN n=1 Tax=Mycolicibacterium elephantis TaxID=81858 RepID=A0A1X0DA92_9MYCO|nr:hypothetical protein [Mycolicibacterium elephantis]ORA69291.1 hypothetical protein BST23_01150 [Mycolicibacterium elephantis]
MATASRTVAVLVLAATTLMASCTRYVDDARAVAGAELSTAAEPGGSDSSLCEAVDVPLTMIPARNDGEPVLKIPKPPGWERSTMMDSPLIRFAMRNEALTADAFTANVMVTLESTSGTEDVDLIFATMQDALESGLGVTDLRVSERSLCGLPARTFRYMMPVMGNIDPHPAVALGAVMHAEGMTFVISVTAQAMDAEDPTYQRDSETILDGFQMLPPSPN